MSANIRDPAQKYVSSSEVSLTLTKSLHSQGIEKQHLPGFGGGWDKGSGSLYRRSEFGFGTGASAAALSMSHAVEAPAYRPTLAERIEDADLIIDLGHDIGSLRWIRGFLTCWLLCLAGFFLAPPLRALPVPADQPVSGAAWEETRAQTIAPLAWGGDSGRRMAASDLVRPLTDTPERPTIELSAMLGQGDGFARVLERAGVGHGEAQRMASTIANIVPLADIKPGTNIKLVLGRRANKNMARPLDAIDFRARLDLALSIRRSGDGLVVTRHDITVNRMPLRVTGLVGDSLYRSARAAGVPATSVEAYIRAIGSKLSFGRDIDASAQFDIIVEQARAETGEIEYGKLLYAGMTRGSRKTQLLQWAIGGRTEWYEASGVGEKRGGMTSPVAGARLTSGFGRRFHPILGYFRFHRGVDFGAAWGTPVRAVSDGLVAFSGRHSGYGNHIRLSHSAHFGTSYSHLSRILVSPGSRVLQGQVIGYVGSTGLSTGPHLHFEVYRDGKPVDPRGVTFASTSLLSGKELDAFRARLSGLLATPLAGSGH